MAGVAKVTRLKLKPKIRKIKIRTEELNHGFWEIPPAFVENWRKSSVKNIFVSISIYFKHISKISVKVETYYGPYAKFTPPDWKMEVNGCEPSLSRANPGNC